MKAYAAVATAPWKVEYLPVTVPDPGPKDVVVRVLHSWISNGTEGSFIRGERIGGDTPRMSSDPMPFPHISGYQKVGIVESIGSAVRKVRPGETVFATVSKVEGMFYDHGGHVSPAVTHESQVWPLPANLDPVSASGLVLLQVGYNMGSCPLLSPGDAVVVIGDGMVGNWAAQTFKMRGARVLLLGKHPYRLSLFKADAQDRVVDATAKGAEDVIGAVRSWAPGGIQCIADSVGSIETVEMLYACVRRFSSIVSAGFYGDKGLIDIQKMRNNEMSLHAPSGWTSDRMDTTLSLLAQERLSTSHLITHRFPVAKSSQAFELILSKKEPVLGVVLDWE